MKAKLFFSFILMLFSFIPQVQAGWQRAVTNYTRLDYKAGTQNWMLKQHHNGWIYVANNQGLLEYDGVSWNLYPIKNAKMRSLQIGNDGRIYVGGITQFGYFEPDKLGGLQYTSLSDSLSKQLNIGTIKDVWLMKEGVYYQAERYLFLLKQGKLKTLDNVEEIKASAIINQKLHIVSSKGLSVLNDSSFVTIKGTEELGNYKVVRMLPYQDKILLVTRYHGLYLYDALGLRKFVTEAEEFVCKSDIFCAALNGSLLALGSVQDGICLLNLKSNEVEIISTTGGLQNKTVLGAMFDGEGNLWLALDNGIDYISLNSRLSSLYGTKTLIGSGYASCVYRDKLYLGTNQGVYQTLSSDYRNRNLPMNFVEGTSGQLWSFLLHDDKLFCASDNGIFIINGARMEYLRGIRGVRRIISLPHRPDVLIAGTYGVNRGLHLLEKKNGKWHVSGKIDSCGISCKSLLAESSGEAIWVANRGEGIFRLKLSDDLRTVTAMKTYNSERLPITPDVSLAYVGDELVVASQYGLWHYVEERDTLETFDTLQTMLGDKSYTFLSTDSRHNIWYSDGQSLKLVRYDGLNNSYHRNVEDSFLKGSLINYAEHVTTYNEHAIISSEGGFSLLDMAAGPVEPKMPLNLRIRKIYLTAQSDSLIYGCSYLSKDTLLSIPYENNSFRLEYSINMYERQHPLMYSHKLVRAGEEGTWSEYSENNKKDFTGLQEGKYLFSVRLLTKEGRAPVETSFAFEILPPWYRTWWSYLLYIGFISLLLYYFYRRMLNSRKRLLLQQELDFLRQKQALQQESELKDQKIDSLKEENWQAELRYKSEELARSTLNIVRKNEILLDIKKEVLGISHAINEENLVSLRRKTLRLLGMIDTNIEHDDDFQTFQSNFDVVHHDFFRHLEEAHPELSNKEKMLCAYIKMNLLSKEIAPLMNLSLRGVEVGRYRLRKKLGLGERDNLVEYLQQFSK